MAYNELETRGTHDFPVSFYQLDHTHPRYFMSAHWHSEIEFIRVLKGELSVTLNGKNYTLKKGDAMFVNSETVHLAEPFDCVYECIVFHLEFLRLCGECCRFFIESILNRDILVCEYFPAGTPSNIEANKIFRSLKTDLKGLKFHAVSAFYEFFGSVYDGHLYSLGAGGAKLGESKNISKLKKILSFIRENYACAQTLESMAEKCNMSPKYFGSFFKSMTGKTPIEYLNEYRTEKAVSLIVSSDMSITDIAFACGFNDLSYFIKTFKKIVGMSPGKFRKK